jgi:hypothetical protein
MRMEALSRRQTAPTTHPSTCGRQQGGAASPATGTIGLRPNNQRRETPLPGGYPYLVTRLVPLLRHVIRLPAQWPATTVRDSARRQVQADRLPTALALDDDFCVYLHPNGTESLAPPPPGEAMVRFP